MKTYINMHRMKVIWYLVSAVIYALLLAATGFVWQALAEAAMGGDLAAFLRVALFSLVFLLLDSFFDYLPSLANTRLINSLMDSLRHALTEHYLRQELSVLMIENPAERAHRLVNDLTVVEKEYLQSLTGIIKSCLVFVFSLAGALYLQGPLTIIMLVLCFIPFLAPWINQKILADKKERAQAEKKQYLAKFDDFSRHISTVILMNAGQRFVQRLGLQSAQMKQTAIDFEKSQAKTYAVSYGLSNIVYSGTWIIGGIFVFYDQLTLPGLIAMTTLMSTVAGPIQTLSRLLTDFSASRNVARDFFALVAAQAPSKMTKEKITAPITTLKLKNVSYTIGQKPIFRQLSFQFQTGNKYVIRGESGAGKSTLLQLLMGIFASDTGTVFVN